MARVVDRRSSFGIGDGIWVGIVAGTAFILAEMFFSQMLGKPFLSPPRLISTIALGKAAAMPGYPATESLVVGFLIHYALSILFGIVSTLILGAIVARNTGFARTWTLVTLGSIGGWIVWLIDFYVIAPAIFPQFGMINPFWNGFVAHAIFGAVLGFALAMRHGHNAVPQSYGSEKVDARIG